MDGTMGMNMNSYYDHKISLFFWSEASNADKGSYMQIYIECELAFYLENVCNRDLIRAA